MKKYLLVCVVLLMALSVPQKSQAQLEALGSLFQEMYGTLYPEDIKSAKNSSEEEFTFDKEGIIYGKTMFPIEILCKEKSQKNISNTFGYYYDSKSNTSRLLLQPEYDLNSDFSENMLFEELEKKAKESDNKGYYVGNATVSFDDCEQFVAKFLYVASGDKDYYGTIIIAVEHAFSDTEVAEIGNGGWNEWSKLKYLNSRMVKKDIDFVLLNTPDEWFIGSLNFSSSTKEYLKTMFDTLGDKCGDYEFYKYSWD